MHLIDAQLNRITMYRLTLYYLIGLVAAALLFSLWGWLPFQPVDLLLQVVLALIVGLVGNWILAWFFKANTNVESVYITTLILILLIPVKFPLNSVFVVGAVAVAMGSKFLLTVEKQHLFNPAAVSLVMIALLSDDKAATWWVGSPIMLPLVLVGGLLVIRKVQRFGMVGAFWGTAAVMLALASWWHLGSVWQIGQVWQSALLRSPLVFLGSVMLTEPLTAPTQHRRQMWYGMLVGMLYTTPQLGVGYAFTPEMALCLGNVYAWFASPHYRLELPLLRKMMVAKDTLLLEFQKPKEVVFAPGQYMEWTLPHRGADQRGNRRYFSLASSPSTDQLQLLVKLHQPSSSYKRALAQLQPGQVITAAHLGGDFELPKDPDQPMLWLAGGVGIAPFMSMAEELLRRQQKVNVILVYSNRSADEIVGSKLWWQAQAVGIKTILTITSDDTPDWLGMKGYISTKTLSQWVPDFRQRLTYISGPQPMVQQLEHELKLTGLPRGQVRTDYFPGYE